VSDASTGSHLPRRVVGPPGGPDGGARRRRAQRNQSDSCKPHGWVARDEQGSEGDELLDSCHPRTTTCCVRALCAVSCLFRLWLLRVCGVDQRTSILPQRSRWAASQPAFNAPSSPSLVRAYCALLPAAAAEPPRSRVL